MDYVRQNFKNGEILTAEHLNTIEDGVLSDNMHPAYTVPSKLFQIPEDLTDILPNLGSWESSLVAFKVSDEILTKDDLLNATVVFNDSSSILSESDIVELENGVIHITSFNIYIVPESEVIIDELGLVEESGIYFCSNTNTDKEYSGVLSLTTVERIIQLDEKYIPDSVKPKQADLSVNDPNSPSYVKGRQFYDSEWSIEWDGTPTEEYIDATDTVGAIIYKIGEARTKEELIGATCKYKLSDGTEKEFIVTADSIQDASNEVLFIVFDGERGIFAVSTQPGESEFMGVTFELSSAATWFIAATDGYFATYVGNRFTKQIPDKFISDNIMRTSEKDQPNGVAGLDENGLLKSSQIPENIQRLLKFDNTPTENSKNPVTSGGVFAALKKLASEGSIGSNGSGVSHWKDLLGKPFYDNSESSTCNFSDGIPEVTTDFFNYRWYKISDIILTKDQLLRTKFISTYNGTDFREEIPVDTEIVFDETYATTVLFSESGRGFFVAHEVGDYTASYQGMEIPLSIPETGIYCAWGINSTPPDTCSYKIEYNEVKQIDDKFVNHDWEAIQGKPFDEKGYHIRWDGKFTETLSLGSQGIFVEWDGTPTNLFIEIPEDTENGIPHVLCYKVAEPIDGTLEYYQFVYNLGGSVTTEEISSSDIIIERDESGELLYSAHQNYWVINFNKAGTYNLMSIVEVEVSEPGLYFIYAEDLGEGNSLRAISIKSSNYYQYPYYRVSEHVNSIQDAYVTLHMLEYDSDDDTYNVSEQIVQLNDEGIGGITVTSLGNSYPTEAPYLFNIVTPEDISLDLDGDTMKIPFTKSGIYFITLDNYAYISSMMSDIYELHFLDEKFIPDSIARKDELLDAYEIGTCVNWELPVDASEDEYVIVDVEKLGELGSACYVKVSEPLQESIVGYKVKLKNLEDGSDSESPSVNEDMGARFFNSGSSSIIYAVNVVTPETLYIEPANAFLEFPEAGLYFLIIPEYGYICSLKSLYYEIKQIDPKFIPEGLSTNNSSSNDNSCPVLPLGYLQGSNGNYTIVNWYKLLASITDYNNIDYSKATYQLPDNFIISFVSDQNISSEEDITIKICTGYGSSGVTSSIAVTLVDITVIERDICYQLHCIKYNLDGTYKGVFISRPTSTISDSSKYSGAVPTSSAVYNYLEDLGIASVDDTPTQYSNSLVKSGGTYTAIQDKATEVENKLKEFDVQADYSEQNPESLSFIKNRLVYDKPVYDNLYDIADKLYLGGYYGVNQVDDSGIGKPICYYNPSSYTSLASSITNSESLLNITKITLTDTSFGTLDVECYQEGSNYYIKDTQGKIPYPLIVVGSNLTIDGITFTKSPCFLLILKDDSAYYNEDKYDMIQSIEYKTEPHKLPNEYLNIDDTPTDGSNNPISSDAVRKIVDAKADYSEQNPDALSYIENKLVYDEPVFPNIYDMELKYSTYSSVGAVTDFERHITYNYFNGKSYEFNLKDIVKITTSKGYLNRADVRLEIYGTPDNEADSWGYALYDAEGKIPYPLVVYVNGTSSITFSGVRFSSASFSGNKTKIYHFIRLDNGLDTEEVISSLEYRTEPHKLSSEYLNIDDTPTEGSNNPVSSDAMHKALKDVQHTLAFDEEPTENSDNLVKSKGIYTAINQVKNQTYSKSEIDGKITGVYHYKGSVDYYADLPTEGNKIGDTYNIKNDSYDSSNKLIVRAGDNVVYYEVNILSADESGQEVIVPVGYWDILAGIVDLSSYATKAELPTKLSQLINDANYLTKDDEELYVITEENKDDEIPENVSLVLDTTEEDSSYDLSEYMRNIPVTDEDEGKIMKVTGGKWSAHLIKSVLFEPQDLTLAEKEQVRKNIGASEVWKIEVGVDTITSEDGFIEDYAIQEDNDTYKLGYVKVCENIYSEGDLVDKDILVWNNSISTSVTIKSYTSLTSSGSALFELNTSTLESINCALFIIIIAPEDVGSNLDGLIFEASGTYLSYYESGTDKVWIEIDIPGIIKIPVDSSYLDTLLVKDEKAAPNGIATLDEEGIIPREQLPSNLGTQTDWDTPDRNSLSYLKNKPFGAERYAEDILWNGSLSLTDDSGNSTLRPSTGDIDLAPILGSTKIVRYIKVSDLMTYNEDKSPIANRDIESLYWLSDEKAEGSLVSMTATTYAYDVGEENIAVYYRKAVIDSGEVPVIYFVESATTKTDASLGSITFPESGIYVLRIDSLQGSFIQRLRWAVENFKTINEEFIPSNIKLPKITEEDEGKILKVVSGIATWVTP